MVAEHEGWGSQCSVFVDGHAGEGGDMDMEMEMDIESGETRHAPSEDGGLEQVEEGGECDEQTEDDSSAHPSCEDGGGDYSCLCQHFEHQNFIRRLESEAHVVFQWMTFFKELVYHLFFPLSLPLIYWYEGGMNGVINRQYLGSRIAVTQWILAISFYAMNALSKFYVTPDIVVANMLIGMRHMVVATKYGFNTKSDMAEMREKVLSHETLDEQTLFLAWTNPIPLRVLKRQLLLAATRNNMLKFATSLRVVPGACRHTVQDIMHQLSNEKKRGFMRSGRVQTRKSHKYSKVESVNCAYCVKNTFTERALEDRWVQLRMGKLYDDPKCQLPGSGEMSEDDSVFRVGHVEETGGGGTHHVMVKIHHLQNGVDLPALMLAAHLLQHSGYLLSKKKFGHQLLKNPMRVWFAAGCIAITHTAIPYVIRAITGEPSVWGGNGWYVYAINFSSILLNFHAMTASVSFMIAGVADFRRRYFSARLLNTLLKDGCVGNEEFLPQAVEVEMCAREQKRQEERRKSEYHTGVAVDYGHASSIVGWWSIRVLVLDFGLVFSRRVKYYASYFCVYCALLMAFLLITVFAKGTRTSSYIMGVVVYDLLVFIGLLALIVFPGGETNKMHVNHGATLVHKRMELATKLRGPLACAPAEERKSYNFALEVMGTISEALTWDNSITKVTILGFKAGGEVLSVLLGFGAAAIGIVAQQFTSYIGST